MDYRNNFKNMTSKELEELMLDSKNLSYEAKVGLKEVLDSRNMPLTESFKNVIETEQKQIEQLNYIGNLGFRIDHQSNGLIILRKTSFFVVDIVTMIIGVLMTYLLTISWDKAYLIYTEGLSFFHLFICVITLLFGGLGVALIIRALSRLIEYSGFKIVKEKTGVTTVIKNSTEYRESVLTDSMFDVVNKDAYHVLVYSQKGGEAIELIKSHGGVRHQQTLHQLKNLLSS